MGAGGVCGVSGVVRCIDRVFEMTDFIKTNNWDLREQAWRPTLINLQHVIQAILCKTHEGKTYLYLNGKSGCSIDWEFEKAETALLENADFIQANNWDSRDLQWKPTLINLEYVINAVRCRNHQGKAYLYLHGKNGCSIDWEFEEAEKVILDYDER